MKIHIVRKPFMCFRGQFTPDKRDLCVGLAISALESTDIFRCYLGKNRTIFYEIDTSTALEYYHNTKHNYVAHSGRDTAILPLKIFNRVDTQPEVIEEKKEEPVNNQVSLL